ncbi:MotA/TolQ/ExbB proton channel family protein [Paucidesulfovibrio gracilis]|nr:MotA/TolQ/ExbB proton channel family protein [Paucidesulfovibrio gracilis]
MNIVQQGGLMMWPLLVVSVVALGVILERFVVISTTRFPALRVLSALRDDIQDSKAAQLPSDIADRYPAFVPFFEALLFEECSKSQREATAQAAGEEILFRLNRGLDLLSTLSNVAPLMGLLGTVIGMISAFSTLAASSDVDISLLAGGIWQALLTTATGLAIAIPTLLAHRWFLRQQEKVAHAMQVGAAYLLEAFHEDDAL